MLTLRGRLLRYHHYNTNRQRKQVLRRFFAPVFSPLRMQREGRDVLIGEITITKSSHRPTNGFVGTLFIYAEETAMKKARQIVKPSASLFSKNHLLFLAFVLYFQRLILEERGQKETVSIQNPQSDYSVSAFDF